MSRIKVNHKVNLGWCFKSLCLAGSLYLVTRGFIELCDWSERATEAKFKKEQREKLEKQVKESGERNDPRMTAEDRAKNLERIFGHELKEEIHETEKEYFDTEKMEFVTKDPFDPEENGFK